ncbi:MAG: hypothetical protein LYZ66_03120 [Nitrososphaerales archaeon]|nr:hypothetical protein [Nitrososphaerales archaeon]
MELPGHGAGGGRVMRVMAALANWREFEVLSASLRAKGYSVAEKIVLAKRRMQVDLLACSSFIALAVDCEHWLRASGGRRSYRRLRRRSARPPPLGPDAQSRSPS